MRDGPWASAGRSAAAHGGEAAARRFLSRASDTITRTNTNNNTQNT
jgi:hypothetical protein